MSGSDASAEALFRLLFGRTTVGYGVIGVARAIQHKGVAWERHAIDVVEDAEGWISAVEMLTRHGLRAELWPWACQAKVLRGIGSGAFSPVEGRVLRAWQSVMALQWSAAPTDEALTRFVEVGGSVIAWKQRHYGLLPLDEARPFGDLNNLTSEVATVLGARPLGFQTALPMPGTWDADFVTDVSVALTQAPASGDDIVLAGLRTQPTPWITAERSA